MLSATPQNLRDLKKHIIILEEVIAEYAAKYGLTDAARAALIALKRIEN